MDSTIKDVQELLRENDTWLTSQIKFLIKWDKGTQEIIGKNYLPRNFYFFYGAYLSRHRYEQGALSGIQ